MKITIVLKSGHVFTEELDDGLTFLKTMSESIANGTVASFVGIDLVIVGSEIAAAYKTTTVD